MIKKEEFVCINCMNPSSSLFTSYSTGRDVIRITECKFCKSSVDKYIEYDIALVIIDLILQYKEAYRHVLFNLKFKSLTRIIFIFLLCDGYKAWIECRHAHSNALRVYDLEWKFYESLLRSIIEFAAYSLTHYLLLKIGNFELSEYPIKLKEIFLIESALIGFYGNLFIVFSIIWELHGKFAYKLLTQIFIFISHIQVQRALFIKNDLKNVMVVLLSVLVQNLAGNFAAIAMDELTKS